MNQLWSTFAAYETDSLNESELFDLRVLVLMLFGIYEKSYFASEYGVLGQSEWQRFEFQICRNFERVEVAGITLFPALSEEFLEFMNAECSDNRETGE